MTPVVAGGIGAGIMAGLSILGGIGQNAQVSKAFVQNAENIKKSFAVQVGQLEEQARSQNDAIALERASQRFAGLQDTAVTSNVLVEREIAGNTARKLYQQSNINKMMAHNVLAKKAEDAMTSFGVEMENARAQANQAIYAGHAQAMANTKSGVSMLSSAIGAGMQGYSMGTVFGSTDAPTTTSNLTYTGHAGVFK